MSDDCKVGCVTVLLTVYKRLDYLEQALISALNQDHNDLEVIVVDDSGERLAEEICRRYVAAGHIIYVANVRNIGIVASVKLGIEMAHGRYIAILNDDDIWEPQFARELAAVLSARPQCNLAFADHFIMNELGAIDAHATARNSMTYGRAILREGPVDGAIRFAVIGNGVPLAMAAMFRKSALDFGQVLVDQVGGAYDYWLTANLVVTGEICYVPKCLTRYRVHPAMETARRSADKNENLLFIYKALLQRSEYSEVMPELLLKLAAVHAVIGRNLLSFGQRRDAASSFWASLQIRFEVKAVLGLVACLLPIEMSQKLLLAFRRKS